MKNEKGEKIKAVSFEKEDLLDLDQALSTIIFDGLVKFKKMVYTAPMCAIPERLLREMFPNVRTGEYYSDDQLAEGKAEWFRILDRMIFAFDSNKEYIPETDPHCTAKRIERLDLEEAGRMLFAKYFNKLWH